MKMSFMYVYSLGQFVTKCQNVSFSSPHNLQRGFIVGLALNCMYLRQLNPVMIEINLVRCDLDMFSIFFALFLSGPL